MDKEMLEQFQMLASMMESMSEKMATKDDLNELRGEIRESETRTRVFIENTVTKRLDALQDGYMLTHEKQYELEREIERKTAEMQAQIDNLQARLAALESKIA